jgi:hypothetical protein
MINDAQLMKAVSSILQRSERQENQDKVVRTFVNAGILPQLNNKNNQVLYGRRGTGKTHILRVLKTELEAQPNYHALYLDMRTLGSTSQFSDQALPLPTRCICLFRDVLAELHDSLLDRLVNNPPHAHELAYQELNNLLRITTQPIEQKVAESAEETKAHEKGSRKGGGAEVSAETLSLKASIEASTQDKTEVATRYAIHTTDKVIFPELNVVLASLMKHLGATFFILLDEWSSIPFDLQPYLAEFLKRGILPNSSVVIKIASLEYRSHFGFGHENGEFTGIEVGSDISAALDIDDYFIYDRNPDSVLDIFSEILYRHLKSELPEDYLDNTLNIPNSIVMRSRLFTNRNIFTELVRASEGIPRDLINIFSSAFFDARRRNRDTIDQKAVLAAARQWFEQDKQKNLDAELSDTLRRIVDEVIGKRRARSFLISRELEKHRMIQRLFDSRVLHLMQRGYADKDNPGTRYNIYTLDYGTYVDLRNTSKEPQLDLQSDGAESADTVVPFDDKRSIRRIVLTQAILEPHTNSRSINN